MSGKVTTHVLDTSCGKPAAGVVVELWKIVEGGESELLTKAVTNQDGRLDKPLLTENKMARGVYELRFQVGDYFLRNGLVNQAYPFLHVIPVRFGLEDVNEHYHVPLLVAPGGYSTYRGS
ncbi:hydroxyisourate hydrolase [Halalkalibacterium halodurans]|uniref:hydroxyisourate hydrolase n=1 Tax=Halalkalibacterium halodurans TaxID=86665 RepID=UPI002AA9CA6B|nr:hydroxyisourate hydrolase [Halalkalibacterium halodurans]MDY7221265.1 hydroxyisourate hydrolase [Halalkalibacterium halodurans]MDY7240504.1 hydroxyisourate hydrolase [Halalkalibacterium halodurans]